MRVNKLDLNQLQVLDALLTERSPTRVAERIGLTQPAISAALRRMREYFGDELFVLNGRRMIPTPFAESLSEPIREMLLRADLVSRMRPATNISAVKQVIRICLSDYASAVLVTPVIQAAAYEVPGLRFEMFSVLDSRGTYHEDLDRGDVDLLILPEVYASDAHPCVVVLQDPYVCIADQANAELGATLDIDTYSALGHVTVSRRPHVPPVFDQVHLARLGVARRVEVSTPSFSMIPQMLMGTQRIATVPSGLAKHFLERWPIRILPCPAPLPPMVQVIQWRQQHDRDPAVSWLKDRVLAEAARVKASGASEGARPNRTPSA